MSGTVGQHDATPQPATGGSFSLKGGFWSLFDVPAPRVPITIFDNTNGILNGVSLVTTTTWLASKFCLGSKPYQLDSVAMLLGVPGFDVCTSTVRLQIFSNDPASGKPSASTGVIMNLSGMTNPVSLSPNLPGIPVT